MDSIIQQHTIQESGKLQCPWVAARATTIKKQGLSEAVVVQIDAPPGEYIRQSELCTQNDARQ